VKWTVEGGGVGGRRHGAGLYVWHEEEEKHAFGGRVEEGPHASSPWTWVVAVRLLEVCGIERCEEGGW
jgi:hypothetical protein